MIIFATGISGSERYEYLTEVRKMAGKKLEIKDIGTLMFEKSKQLGINIPEGKILDLDPYALKYLRAAIFEEILKEMHLYRGPSKRDLIISSHTCFRWKKHLLPAFNFHYLNQLDPDLYITIVDNVHYIKARLEARSHWRSRLSLKDIMIWRDEEIFVTEMIASFHRKPHYMIARNEPPKLLYNIIYGVEKRLLMGEKAMPKAYLSYPITYMRADSKWMMQKDKVKERLREAGIIVFDPISIEEAEIIGQVEQLKKKGEKFFEVSVNGCKCKIPISEVEAIKEDIVDQIVVRDYKLIEQSDMIIVFYPVKTLSPGVLSEINYGFTHNKDVYAIFPYETRSPFFEYYTTKIFKNVNELISHLKEIEVIGVTKNS